MAKIKPQFTAVFKKSSKWYVGWVEEIAGVNTQGTTLKEAKENLKEALDMVLEANREQSRTMHRSSHMIRTVISPSL